MNLRIEIVDLLVFLIYLMLVVGLGYFVGRGQKNLTSYLLGDRSLPWWAILGSIVATETSTVTFLSVPGISFGEGGNLTFLQLTLGYIVGRFLVTVLLLPGYFQGSIFSAYELLEAKFGRATQRVASSIFLVARNFGDALRLYLTAVVLEAMFGFSLTMSICIIGTLTIAYTLLGGMKAVIWNDCLQLVVYLLGGGLIMFIIVSRLPEGWASVTEFAEANNRFQLFDFSMDPSKAYTLWAGLVGGIFLTLGTHGVDQMLVQRYLSAKSRNHASAALITSGFVVCLQFTFFLLLGVALAAYFDQHGIVEEKGDRALANFIVNELPAGIGLVGFILAGVFAAAMSTLSSSLNSSATVVVNDFLKTEEQSSQAMLKWSRTLTAVFGILQMLIAISAAQVSESVVTEVLGIAGMTVGLLLGLFALARLCPACKQVPAILGMMSAAGLLVFLKLYAPQVGINVAWPWYALIGSSCTVLVAWLIQLVLPNQSSLP